MTYIGTFKPELEKVIVIFQISTFELAKMQSLMLNKKNQIWKQKCLIGAFLDWNLKNSIVIFAISTFKFVKIQNFM